MRKIMLFVLLCLSLLLVMGALAEAAVDVDLTDLDTVDAIDALYALADAPEDNQGRVVRLTGFFSYFKWDNEEIFLLISDGASCCASQIEFVPAESPDDLEQLTLSDEPITLQGVLDIYDNDGYDDIRLIEAQVERTAL